MYQLIGEMHDFESDIIAFLAPKTPSTSPAEIKYFTVQEQLYSECEL